MLITRYLTAMPYSLISVIDAGAEMNEWTPVHDAQGFSWQPGSVTLSVRGDPDLVWVYAYAGTAPEITLRPMRSILVPFPVSGRGPVELASPVTDRFLQLATGPYALLFETGDLRTTQKYGGQWVRRWCRLTFTPGEIEEARILIQDDELEPAFPLSMHANPA